MGDCLQIGGTRRSVPASFQPIFGRPVGEAAFAEMVGQHFGPYLDDVRELLLQRHSDAPMQRLTRTAQKGAVGGILYQCMLEQIGCMWRHALPEHKCRLDKPIEPRFEICVGATHNCGQ
jgi:hypothetical protein